MKLSSAMCFEYIIVSNGLNVMNNSLKLNRQCLIMRKCGGERETYGCLVGRVHYLLLVLFNISRKGVHNIENFHIKGAHSVHTHKCAHCFTKFMRFSITTPSSIRRIHGSCIALHILHRFTFSPSMQI